MEGDSAGYEADDYIDVLLEFPDLDGLELLSGLSFQLRDLHGAVPEATLGDVVFRGRHELAIGTVLAAGAPPLCEAFSPALHGGVGCGLVSLPSLTSKKVVFHRYAGEISNLLVDGGVGNTPMPAFVGSEGEAAARAPLQPPPPQQQQQQLMEDEALQEEEEGEEEEEEED
jgi:hypothetical protein